VTVVFLFYLRFGPAEKRLLPGLSHLAAARRASGRQPPGLRDGHEGAGGWMNRKTLAEMRTEVMIRKGEGAPGGGKKACRLTAPPGPGISLARSLFLRAARLGRSVQLGNRAGTSSRQADCRRCRWHPRLAPRRKLAIFLRAFSCSECSVDFFLQCINYMYRTYIKYLVSNFRVFLSHPAKPLVKVGFGGQSVASCDPT
jgi:hypothetical protein